MYINILRCVYIYNMYINTFGEKGLGHVHLNIGLRPGGARDRRYRL